ncbi:hypothetical protein ACH5RR_001290 [Cinchona calisaya]|uniref:Uncharacterized protein n=1 Tax=Cinchona calisaya TaxID=153742 RepID=A0ABD3B399_9GENT
MHVYILPSFVTYLFFSGNIQNLNHSFFVLFLSIIYQNQPVFFTSIKLYDRFDSSETVLCDCSDFSQFINQHLSIHLPFKCVQIHVKLMLKFVCILVLMVILCNSVSWFSFTPFPQI